MTAHRTFPTPCEEPPGTHRVGDRHVEDGHIVDELTDKDTWAPVCPTDDVPMAGRDKAGWLICPVCLLKPSEVSA